MVNKISKSASLMFSDLVLNRCSIERKQSIWLDEQLRVGSFLIVSKGLHLLNVDSYQPIFCSYSQVVDILSKRNFSPIFLGLQNACPLFVVDITDFCDQSLCLPTGKWHALRDISAHLDNQTASLLMLSYGLSYWHRHNRFCGRCGHLTRALEGGNTVICSDKNCGYQTFPRTDSAVIMTVTKVFNDGVERVLLGRNIQWTENVFSCLAGYVDQGETLEQAVCREVFEESGITVDNVHYVATQPWLFPTCLMIGFTATASTEALSIDRDELTEAKWFSRSELKQFLPYAEVGDGYKWPRSDSISWQLMHQWLTQLEDS